jgi:hypothetical protein
MLTALTVLPPELLNSGEQQPRHQRCFHHFGHFLPLTTLWIKFVRVVDRSLSPLALLTSNLYLPIFAALASAVKKSYASLTARTGVASGFYDGWCTGSAG